MVTTDFIVMLIFSIVLGTSIICLLIFGVCAILIEHDKFFFGVMMACTLFTSILFAIAYRWTCEEYQRAIPQNQAEILRQKISDDEKEYQKFLIDHFELKESE